VIVFVSTHADVRVVRRCRSVSLDPLSSRFFITCGWWFDHKDWTLFVLFLSSPSIPLTWRWIYIYLTWAQRLKANTKTPFSFIVDDQTALENWFAWRSIEQVLEQVISLAKSSDYVDLVQLQFWNAILPTNWCIDTLGLFGPFDFCSGYFVAFRSFAAR